jgi:cytochrome c2
MPFSFWPSRPLLLCALGWLVLPLAARAAPALELHRDRASPWDLAISGKLTGVPAGETRFVRWAELRKLPVTKLFLSGEFVPGEQQLTTVTLADVWSALPCASGADTILATCGDGYTAIYQKEFVAKYRPFVVLEINGDGPEKWPPAGLQFNPGPYVITVSAAVMPGVERLLDVGHKKPWAVVSLEVANFRERERDAFVGKWAQLSPSAEAGREIWINSCASCHRGPGNMFGGTKAERPFEVLAAHAAFNEGYFRKYVREPRSVMPGARMEAHPHYTDAQLDDLVAFITADGKR